MLLEMVTRNAYIIIAVKGTGFASAGRRAFRLIRDNFASLAVVNLIAEVVLFLSKVFVACAAAFICFWFLDTRDEFQDGGEYEISSSWLPVLLTMIFAFAVASGFFSIFDMAIDTVLVCYILVRCVLQCCIISSRTYKPLSAGARTLAEQWRACFA